MILYTTPEVPVGPPVAETQKYTSPPASCPNPAVPT